MEGTPRLRTMYYLLMLRGIFAPTADCALRTAQLEALGGVFGSALGQILVAFGDKTDTQIAHYVLFINVAGYFGSHCGLRTAHCALRSWKLWGALLGALWGRYL